MRLATPPPLLLLLPAANREATPRPGWTNQESRVWLKSSGTRKIMLKPTVM